MEQNVKQGLATATMVIGIIAFLFSLLPLINPLLIFFTGLNYLVVLVGVILGVVALIKKQNAVKSIVGLALCVLAFFMPYIIVVS